jgi:hypothetical protein
MATALSTLTSLEDLSLEFNKSFQYRPHSARRSPPPLTRFVLPVFTFFFSFRRDGEYLEDLVAHIDAPQLGKLRTMFFNDIVFDTPQLFRFIRCTSRLKTFENANVVFENGTAWVYLYQLSDVERLCTSSLPPPSFPVPLCEYEYKARYTRPVQDNIEDTLWLDLLLPFTAMKSIFLSEEFMQRIMPVLPDLVGRRTTEVLPNLQTIILEVLPESGPVSEGIRQFVASRQGTSHPIKIFLD